MTEDDEVCDQSELNSPSELNVLVSLKQVCMLAKKRPELLCRQIELTVALADSCQAKLRVRSTRTFFWQKPHRFRSGLGCLIEATEIAIGKSLS